MAQAKSNNDIFYGLYKGVVNLLKDIQEYSAMRKICKNQKDIKV